MVLINEQLVVNINNINTNTNPQQIIPMTNNNDDKRGNETQRRNQL